MVNSWYCLDRVVMDRMSQVWRWSEVGNHKRRSLNTRLSSGTSANTSCRSRNAPGRRIRYDLFWYRNNLKMKPTYREKNLLDYLFGGFRSTLNIDYHHQGHFFCERIKWFSISKYRGRGQGHNILNCPTTKCLFLGDLNTLKYVKNLRKHLLRLASDSQKKIAGWRRQMFFS